MIIVKDPEKNQFTLSFSIEPKKLQLYTALDWILAFDFACKNLKALKA